MKTYLLIFTDGYDISLRGIYHTIDEAEQVMSDDFNAYGGIDVPEEWISQTYLSLYDARRMDGNNVYAWKIIVIEGE